MTCINKLTGWLQLALTILPLYLSAQTYTAKGIKTTLFSSTPLEDIRAASYKGTAVFNIPSGELIAQIPVRSFEFDKKLMQQHFNENYMDSDRHPYARFKGAIDRRVDLNKNGTYALNIEGVLTVHGIEKKRVLPAQFTVKDGRIHVNTKFTVNCADHDIKIPTLMFKKIAECIHITADGQLQPLK